MASRALTKALTFQSPMARKNFERLRRVHPDDSPQDLAARISKHYLGTVTASGGAAGGAGVIPGAGIPAAGIDIVVFTEASVLYVLTLAEIHGLHPEDVERRRLLVQTVLIGESAVTALNTGAGRSVPYWGRQIVERIPMSAVNTANKILGPRFITKYGTKQGVMVLSKQVPFGIGAGLGAGANHLVGRAIVKTAKKVFGPPPVDFTPPPVTGPLDVEAIDFEGLDAEIIDVEWVSDSDEDNLDDNLDEQGVTT